MASYLAAVWRCRYFWLSLVKMDLQTRYRRSVLGVAWSLLHPLAMTLVLSLVFHRLVAEPVADYAPYVLAGLALWNYLLTVVLQGCQCFFQSESYIRQHPAPLAIYPLRTALGALFHFLVALGVVFAMAWYFKGFENPVALLTLIPTIVLLFVLGWTLAMLAGLATVYFHDVRHIAEIALQILFYATPIIYRVSMFQSDQIGWVAQYNPVTVFMDLVRYPIVGPDRGMPPQAPSLLSFGIACGIVLLCIGLSSLALTKLQKRLIFHL